MICINCGEENGSDRVSCWKCNTRFRNEIGELVGCCRCEKCDGTNLKLDNITMGKGIFSSLLLLCIGGFVFSFVHEGVGELIVGIGLLSLVGSILMPLSNKYGEKKELDIVCLECKHQFGIEMKNIR